MKKHYLFLCLLLGLMASVRAQSTFNPKGGNRSYSVPSNGTVTITAVGGSDGSGASGGTGAFIEATFAVQADDELIVVVGADGNTSSGGRGGGSAVLLTRDGTTTLLLVSGGASSGHFGQGGKSQQGTPAAGGAGFGGGSGFDADGENSFGDGGKKGTLMGGGNGGTDGSGYGFGGGAGGSTSPTLEGDGGGYGWGAGGIYASGQGGTSFITKRGRQKYISYGLVVRAVRLSLLRTPISSLPINSRRDGIAGSGGSSAGQVQITFFPAAGPSLSLSTLAVADVKCQGGSDGSITVSASGGTEPYSYNLTPGNITNSTGKFTDLALGNYNVTVPDANQDTDTQEIRVEEPASPPSFTTNSSNVNCRGGSDGFISVSATGGTVGVMGMGYTYSNDGGKNYATSSAFTGLSAGTYQIRVQDANDCETGGQSVTITEPASLPKVTISGNTSVIYGFGSNCTTLTASGSGGTAPYSYSWKTAGGTPLGADAQQQVCPTETMTYIVTITDANGCNAENSVTVTVKDVRCGPGNQNVQICYYGVSQCVSQEIAERYLKLGATLGSCNTSKNRARIGSEEILAPLTLKAFPNPVQDAVTVEVLAPSSGAATFDVVDLTGRTRQTRTEILVEGLNQIELRLGALPTGLY